MTRKSKKLRTVLLAVGSAAVLVLLSTCTNPVFELLNARSWGLVGTWIDASRTMSDSLPQPYKLILNSDGTFTTKDQSGAFTNNGSYTIESVTTGNSLRTFKLNYVWGAGAFHTYVLAQVGASTYESNGYSMMPYPTSVNPGDTMTYSKMTIQ